MKDFLMGAIAMGHMFAGFFFLRFWGRTHDRLFLLFAIAFWLLGIIRLSMTAILQVYNVPTLTEHEYLFWVRFAAYVLILAAIIDKNLR